jgi:hypothetical protein
VRAEECGVRGLDGDVALSCLSFMQVREGVAYLL